MTNRLLEYKEMYVRVFHNTIKEALQLIVEKGLVSNHHFYITFNTQYKGVILPPYLQEKFPNKMTIVLQYEFYNLNVTDDHFQVTLSFNNVLETLTVPYSAIRTLADPSAEFHFEYLTPPREKPQKTPVTKKIPVTKKKNTKSTTNPPTHKEESPNKENKKQKSAKVITLDTFRKK